MSCSLPLTVCQMFCAEETEIAKDVAEQQKREREETGAGDDDTCGGGCDSEAGSGASR